jgi:uncharacterized protein (DUF488 family)
MMSDSQPVFKRQRFLLAFIRQINSGVSSTDLQKLVFLHAMEENSGFYDFLPYKFGPYSYLLAEDVDTLRRDGFVMIENARIQSIGGYAGTDLFSISTERGNTLIRKVYRAYPYYAINSEVITRLFSKKEAGVFAAEKQKYNQAVLTLFTIGYEGRSIESFINTLVKSGVHLLCDVRKSPLSRKFGFSKNRLEHITKTIGIQYIHIPELGIETDKRSSLETLEDYQKLFADYAKTLPSLSPHLENIHELLCSHVRIALMCYEKDAEMCHRHLIRDHLKNAHDVKSFDL